MGANNRGLYKRGKMYWVCCSGPDGKVIRKSSRTSNRETAERILAKIKDEIALGTYGLEQRNRSSTFDDMDKQYLTYSRVNKRSWKRDEQFLKKLGLSFAGKRLSAITPEMIENYKAKRSQEVSKATVNRELSCLRHMFNLAIKWGKAGFNPLGKVKFFKEGPWEMRILSREEERLLLEKAVDHLKPMIVCAVNTGMRKGEILGLTWDKVDIVNGVITVMKTKNGEMRKIPMNKVLKSLFQQLRAVGRSDYVFCHRDGSPFLKAENGFRAAVKRAGIGHCRFHDLRHTFATRLVQLGVDLVTVKEILGHKSITTTMRYAHPTSKHKQWAVEMLNMMSPEEEAEKAPEVQDLLHNYFTIPEMAKV